MDPIPDESDFRRLCHRAARRTGGTVTSFRMCHEVTPNFHQGLIAYRDRTVAVVLARDCGAVAIAVPRDLGFTPSRESGPLTFLDVPDLAAALVSAGAHVRTAEELGAELDPASWPHLRPREIRFWKPSSLGEALFNYWD